jgi:hypothetical protein
MQKISVAEPFNYGHGPDVTHYPVGPHEVSRAVAAHAKANGFIAADKAETKPKAEVAKQ